MMRSNKTNGDEMARLEHRLARALQAQAERTQPSADAYARLAGAVAESRASRTRRAFTHWARPVGFVTVTLAAVGVGAYLIAQQGSQAVDTIDAAPATADASDLFDPDVGPDQGNDAGVPWSETEGREVAAEVSEADAPVADDPARSGPGDADEREDVTGEGYGVEARSTEVGATYAPVKSTKLGAAQAFLDLIDLDYAVPELEAGQLVVRSLSNTEDELGPVISALTVEEVAGGYLVVEASSQQVDFQFDNLVDIDPVDDNTDDPAVALDAIAISGVGDEPGRSLALDLRSAVDGTTLDSMNGVDISTDEDGGFSADWPAIGSERVWVVVTSSADDDGAAPAFAAQSVLYIGPAEGADYTVVRLPPDDVDQGLVLRATPGGRRIGVIDLGATGVRRQPIAPRKVGSHVWWAVETEQGRQGWVASLYLTPADPISDKTLLDLGQRLAATGGKGGLGADGISVSYPALLGDIIGPRAVYNALDAPSTWIVSRNLSGVDGSNPTSLADFFGVDRWAGAEVVVPDGYLDPAAEASARSYFGDLPSVVIRSRNPDSLLWERVHIFFSRRGSDVAIVGIVREVEPGAIDLSQSEDKVNGRPKPDVGPVDPVDR